MNYPQIQNKIKRDPESYADEFQQQLVHYQSLLSILTMKPEDDSADLRALLIFLSHVSHCYKSQMASFPVELLEILEKYASLLHPEMRKCIVSCLFLLKNKNIIESQQLYPHFFMLFKCQDKDLRESVYFFILNDLKHSRNGPANKTLQNLFFSTIDKSDSLVVVRHVLRLLIALFKKGIWADSRTVSVVCKCCFSKDIKCAVVALNFFTAAGSTASSSDDPSSKDNDNDSEDEENYEKKYKDLLKNTQITGKRKSKHAKMKRALDKLKKKDRKEKTDSRNFFAIEMLNDPQEFAERLFVFLRTTNERFKIKLLAMNVLSTLVAVHRLLVLDFYSFVTRYANPHQRDVTLILTYATQALHEFVPSADAEILLRAVANAFVADHCASEVVVVGLNTIREMCRRCPLAISDTLLQDLAMYKTSKDKGVSMAARSLIALYRDLNPALLHKRDRGKEGNVAARSQNESSKSLHMSEDVSLGSLEPESAEAASVSHESEADTDLSLSDADESSGLEERFSTESDSEIKDFTASDDEECSSDEKESSAPKSTNVLTKRPLESQETKMIEKKLKASGQKAMPQKTSSGDPSGVSAAASGSTSDSDSEKEHFDQRDILGLVKPEALTYQHSKKKASYKERMASIEEGRTDRLKYGSRKGDESRGSKTNKEKSKKKNFMMMVHKRDVKLKSKRSIKEKQVNLQKSRKKRRYNK